MTMTFFESSECMYEVESDWIDQTEYVFVDGDVRVATKPFASLSETPGLIDAALERFRASVPRHTLVERRPIDKPGPGEIIVHKVGGDASHVEIVVHWGIGDLSWMLRASGPLEAEQRCRDIIETFVETYRPVEAP